ncbi:hypothetical protein KIN20_034772 [Parelaphostrongylus tenuis]|uniref:Uncharacterized protein n=1 Tax=Parelaphostrongylus tenuis TaxID=148309 RepID=A0AAD5RAU4_PARTN|nr:hypothetical protein KIN20_034772 [Parelaphostrongylus tenuis]
MGRESWHYFKKKHFHVNDRKNLRKSVTTTTQMICGPDILSAERVEMATIRFGQLYRTCCLISAHPKPNLVAT